MKFLPTTHQGVHLPPSPPAAPARFLGDTRGYLSIEQVAWLPLGLCAVLAMTDASLAYVQQARLWELARDTAHQVATGRMSATESMRHAKAALPSHGHWYVSIQCLGTDVLVRISSEDPRPGLTGLIAALDPDTLAAEFRMRLTSATPPISKAP